MKKGDVGWQKKVVGLNNKNHVLLLCTEYRTGSAFVYHKLKNN